MNILPLITTLGPLVLKTVAGLNVDKQVRESAEGPLQYHTDKPFYLTRRFIGMALMTLGCIYSAITGVDLPGENLAALTDNLDQVGTLYLDNKELFVTTWGALLAVGGQIRKGKSE